MRLKQQCNDKEFAELYEKVYNANKKFIYTYIQKGVDKEDAEQLVALSVLKAKQSFSENKGNFNNYASVILQNEIKNEYFRLFPFTVKRLSSDAKAKAVESMLRTNFVSFSIDDNKEYGSTFDIPYYESGYDDVVNDILAMYILEKLKSFKSYQYILYKFGFCDGKSHSYEEVALKFNQTKRFVRYMVITDLNRMKSLLDYKDNS